jgi:hypothetical protein
MCKNDSYEARYQVNPLEVQWPNSTQEQKYNQPKISISGRFWNKNLVM